VQQLLLKETNFLQGIASAAASISGNEFSKVLYIVTLYSKYTRALTFENFIPQNLIPSPN
jgi:hypothetical protein